MGGTGLADFLKSWREAVNFWLTIVKLCNYFEAGEPKSSYHSWQSESTHGFPAAGWFKP